MILKSLILENFKGLNFTLNTNGNNVVNVYAMNRAGKSRLFDAYTFGLFGKDSFGNSDFPIKNIKDSGETEHGLEHAATLEFEDPDIVLKRIYKEIWGKRGQFKGVLKSHTTDYEIDGVPNKKKKDYDDVVNNLCDEKLFKMLTDPHYFNDKLHWKERLAILIELSGGKISDEDVINAHPELADFPQILDGKSADDRKEIIRANRLATEKEVEKIPIRINEVNKGTVECREVKQVNLDLELSKNELMVAQGELKEIKAGGESEILTTKLREIENKLIDLDNKEAAETLKAQQTRNKERQEPQRAVDDIKYSIETFKRDKGNTIKDIDRFKTQITNLEKEIKKLKSDWWEENDKKFHHEESTACYACGQPLPKKKIEHAHNKALERFNVDKANKLNSINNAGKAAVKSVESDKHDLDDAEKKLIHLEKIGKDLNTKLSEAEKALEDFEESLKTEVAEESPERIHLLNEKENLEIQIVDKKGSVDPLAVREAEAQIEAIEIKIKAYDKELMQIEANKRIEVRIQELKDKERSLSGELEELERQFTIIEDFNRKRAKMIEIQVNPKFKLTKWCMGENFMNEGWKDDCYAISNGKPYKAMSSSESTTIGIDIIDTLSHYYQKFPPMFIDNAEHISEIPETKAQQIRLYVSPDDKELRIE